MAQAVPYYMFCLFVTIAFELATTSVSHDDALCTDASAIAAECDIGKLLDLKVNIGTLSREDIYRILTSESSTDPTSYPRTRTLESAGFRQFQPSWLKSYPWLHYSRHVDGAFCRACAIFMPETVGGQRPGQFVS